MKNPPVSSRIAGIVLAFPVSLYLVLIIMLILHRPLSIPVAGLLFLLFFICLLSLSGRLGPWGMSLGPALQKKEFRVFGMAFGACMICFLIGLAAFYPGGISSDTIYQLAQAHGTKELTDWHPALHTLILAFLCRIWDSPVFCLVIQLLIYSSAVGLTACTLHKYRIPKAVLLLVTAYLILSPAISNLMLFIWKDCAFAITMLFLTCQLVDIHFSHGEWLRSPLHLLCLALTLCLSSILRHNGPALSLPVGIWLLVSFPGLWKRLIVCICCAAAFFGLIKGPLYNAAGVEYEWTGLGEMIGVPMTVLANVYVESPESLEPDIVEFMEDVAPRSVFETYHSVGDWNEIKFQVGMVYTNKPYTLVDVFSFAARAAIRQPRLALEALSYLWQMPMWPFSDAYWRVCPSNESDLTFRHERNPFLNRILNALCRWSAKPFFAWLFWLPGTFMLILVVACALFAPFRKPSALLPAAGLIPYHLATSLFLSSSTDFRFFLGFQMCVPLALICLLFIPFSYTEPSKKAERT